MNKDYILKVNEQFIEVYSAKNNKKNLIAVDKIIYVEPTSEEVSVIWFGNNTKATLEIPFNTIKECIVSSVTMHTYFGDAVA